MTGDTQAKRRPFALGVLTALLGLALFAYVVWRAGVDDIAGGVARVGAGFLLILALSGLRIVARSLAWVRSVEPPHTLPSRDAMAATLMGEAIGNLTPLANLAGEPAKAMLVGRRVPLDAALAAILAENLLYSVTVAIVIGIGTLALVAIVALPPPLQRAATVALWGVGIILAIAAYLLLVRPKPLAWLLGWFARRGSRIATTTRVDKLGRLEERIYGFYSQHPRRLGVLLPLEAAFHVAGIAEVYVTLALLLPDSPASWLTALVLESVNRAINVVFRFVPMRLGVDEAGSGLLTEVLGIGAVTGVTLAVVRKARVLFWTAIGVALLVRRGWGGPR